MGEGKENTALGGRRGQAYDCSGKTSCLLPTPLLRPPSTDQAAALRIQCTYDSHAEPVSWSPGFHLQRLPRQIKEGACEPVCAVGC